MRPFSPISFACILEVTRELENEPPSVISVEHTVPSRFWPGPHKLTTRFSPDTPHVT